MRTQVIMGLAQSIAKRTAAALIDKPDVWHRVRQWDGTGLGYWSAQASALVDKALPRRPRLGRFGWSQ